MFQNNKENKVENNVEYHQDEICCEDVPSGGHNPARLGHCRIILVLFIPLPKKVIFKLATKWPL